MTIILQPKRLLITEFFDDDLQRKFLKYITVETRDFYLQVSKVWTAAYETTYKGQPVLAVPRRFNKDMIDKCVVCNELIRDNNVIPHANRAIENNFDFKNEDQIVINQFLRGIGEFNHLAKSPRRALFASTGAGKTFSTLKAISQESHFAFINCPDDKAILTWREEILKFTNITEEEIGYIKGRNSLAKLVKNKEKYKIILCSSKTLSSLFLSNDFAIVEQFFNDMEFSLIVHDEVHLNLLVVFYIEMIAATKRTYYLTATPTRRIYKESKVLESLMPNEDAVLVQEVEARFDYYRCNYYSNPISKEHVKGINKPGGFDYLTYGKKIIFNPNEELGYSDEFKKNLVKVVKHARKKLTNPNNKIAVLCKVKEENEILRTFFTEKFPELSLGVFNSDIKDMDERFDETNRQLILSTDRSFAGIINIPKLEAIIMIYPTTTESHLLQIAGRIREEKGKKSLLYIMADMSFKRLRKNMNTVKSIIKDHCVSITEVTLNENSSSVEVIVDDED